MLAVNFIFFSPVQAQNIHIDSLFTSDGEIFPFGPNDTIYGLSISGYVALSSDTSLVRVILTDNSGNEWMVYEAYPFINSNWDFDLIEMADETMYRQVINPHSLKVQLINALIKLDKAVIQDRYRENLEILQENFKNVVEDKKVDSLNYVIILNSMLWRANRNPVSDLTYKEKVQFFGENYNLLGLDYYSGGIYDGIPGVFGPNDNSDLTESFDWRNRHGANDPNKELLYYDGDPNGSGWMTDVKNQDDYTCSGLCYIYAPLAAVEGLANLYFNIADKNEDFDLSEQNVLDCDNYSDNQCVKGYSSYTNSYLYNPGVLNEACYIRRNLPGSCLSENPPDGNPAYRVKIAGTSDVDLNTEAIKSALIHYGPLLTLLEDYYGTNNNHFMALVGYGRLKASDIFHVPSDPSHPIIVLPGSDYIGKLYWIFKNSKGPEAGDNGYFYHLEGDTKIIECSYYKTPIDDILDTNDVINAYDKDHDGYWNWGISESYDLPEGTCSVLEDSDDSENRIGPFDSHYNGIPVKPEIEVNCFSFQVTKITNHGFFFFNTNNSTLTFQIKNPGSAKLHLDHDEGPLSISWQAGNDFTFEQAVKYELCMFGDATEFKIHFSTAQSIVTQFADFKIAVLNIDKDVLEDFEFELVYNGCNYNGGDLTVNTYYPINENEYQLMSGDIYIERGGIMEVFGSLAMYGESDIYIKPGGQLIVNGGLITGIVGNCPNLWHGIDVWGNASQPQTIDYQGWVRIINGGCIEYAETAIETVICPGCEKPLPTGGIVSCSDAIFKDNINDVHLYPYTNRNPVNHQILPNFSRFYKTIFKTTDDLFTISGNSPSTHLYLDNVGGLIITGCTFGNYSTRINESRGKGIESYGAGYFVSTTCTEDGISPCPSTIPCRFENLDYGIRAFNTNSYYTITVNSAEFIHNRRGIHLGLVENPTIISSTFDISDPENLQPNDTLVGLYLDEFTTGFLVEENDFTGPGRFSKTIGIHLMNTGTNQNEIYNNNFSKLKAGIMAVGTNRLSPHDQDPGCGLCIKCNDFIACNNDVWVTPVIINGIPYPTQNTGIAQQQGELGHGSKTKSAGNTFSNLSSCTYYNAQYCGHIDYTYLNGANSPDNVVPLHTSGDITLIGDDYADYSKAESCPSHLGGSINLSLEKNNLISETILIDAYQDTLLMTTDGGNTEGLNYEVLTSFPEEALVIRQELMEKSPYLSDTVMISAIGKEEVLPGAMVRDILVSNPQAPKSMKIMNALDQRQDTFPDYMMDEIMQGMNTFGAKELLEQKIGSHQAKKEKALTNINLFYKNDTANWNYGIDSLIVLYENQNKLSYKYELAFLFLNKSDSTNAFGILNSIPGEFDLDEQELLVHDQYQELFEILWDTKNDSIRLDSLHIQALLEMSSVFNNLPGIFASNLLIKEGILIYNEPVYLGEDIVKTIDAPANKTEIENEKSHLKLFPNPAGNYFIASYDLRKEESPGFITISDVNGKELRVLLLKDKQNQIVIPVLELTSGVYIIKLLAGNEMLDAEKISINR